MSAQIYFEFRTLSWIYINWPIINFYVTRLKFRIYKAAVQKQKGLMHYLQMQLINSLIVYLFVLQQIDINDDYFLDYLNSLNDIQKIFIIKNIYYDKLFGDNKRTFHLLQKYLNTNKYTAKVRLKLFDIIYMKVLFLSLESEWLAYQHINNVYFYNMKSFKEFLHYFKINITMSLSGTYFIKYINLLNFVSNWHSNFLCSRLTTNLVLHTFIKEKLLSNINLNSLYLQEQINTDKYFFHMYFIQIIIYNLCLETHLLYQLKVFTDKIFFSTLLDFKILHNRFELLLLSKNHIVLFTWYEIFLQLINDSCSVRKKIVTTNIVKLLHGISFMDYFIYNYNNIYFYIAPSSIAQSFLLSKTSIIFIKLKGSSKIKLVITLQRLLNNWIKYFYLSNSIKIFFLLDYLIYLKLKRWSTRRHSTWKINQIRSKSIYSQIYQLRDIKFIK
uniref:Retron-type RNA-directed DNA polymerase n=1 Tax=Thorea hispida TaxID=202687 RepID=A0A1Z1XAJ2_9FLOR|nr:retron-type RNA-directed DNA polymerase [Thorea hispida]